MVWIHRPFANDHPDGPASCKWSSRWTGLLKMIIQMNWPLTNDHLDGPPLANDHPNGPTSKNKQPAINNNKLQMQILIWIDWPIANDHPDEPASCAWSSRWTGLLKMIIWMDRPFANDHRDGPAPCKLLSAWTSRLQMILIFAIYFLLPPKNIFSRSKYSHPFPSLFKFSSAKYILIQILSFFSFSANLLLQGAKTLNDGILRP